MLFTARDTVLLYYLLSYGPNQKAHCLYVARYVPQCGTQVLAFLLDFISAIKILVVMSYFFSVPDFQIFSH